MTPQATIICIKCPLGCRIKLTANNRGDIIGMTDYECEIGQKYVQNEFKNPVYSKALEPEPRVREGLFLGKYVNSMMDISDGLAMSLKEISSNSGVGALIELDRIPVDNEAIVISEKHGQDVMEHALYGEGDYELLFTVSEENLSLIQEKFGVSEIGRITKEKNIVCIDLEGKKHRLASRGYEHFK